jgi:hypothetical protein
VILTEGLTYNYLSDSSVQGALRGGVANVSLHSLRNINQQVEHGEIGDFTTNYFTW